MELLQKKSFPRWSNQTGKIILTAGQFSPCPNPCIQMSIKLKFTYDESTLLVNLAGNLVTSDPTCVLIYVWVLNYYNSVSFRLRKIDMYAKI